VITISALVELHMMRFSLRVYVACLRRMIGEAIDRAIAQMWDGR
jgi:hypothetical protein